MEVVPSSSWLERQPHGEGNKPSLDKEGGKQSPNQDFADLKEQSMFTEFVLTNWFADLKGKKKKGPLLSSPKKSPNTKNTQNNTQYKLASENFRLVPICFFMY